MQADEEAVVLTVADMHMPEPLRLSRDMIAEAKLVVNI
jgi:hypothetical protein